MRKIEKYFSQHVYYGNFVHLLISVGIGILLTIPYFGDHPVRWGAGFIVVGLVGHLAPFFRK